jgi:hypothetical protein
MQELVGQNTECPEIDVMPVRSTEDHLRWKIVQCSAVGCPSDVPQILVSGVGQHILLDDHSPATRCVNTPPEIGNFQFPV